jgi:aspartate kinase
LTAIVVQKYGGSSVADATGIKRVAERIAATRRAGKQVCVVVSAMGKTTDELLERAREVTDAPSRRELDMLLTCGERASMALLSMAVSELGYEAISFTGSQAGVMTNDRHSGAQIIEVRPVRVLDELDRGRVVIVAGFQGVSYKREITTLGRGGSDTTAVALAGALGAEYCEICSDVDGIYTADPRIVSAAELLDAISHDEMLELAAHGARVLHAESVELARRSGIALYARASAKDGGGTRIDRVGSPDRAVAGVAGAKSIVHVAGTDSAPIMAALAEAKLAVFEVREMANTIDVWLALDDVPDWPRVRDALTAAGAQVREDIAAATVVGRGIGGAPAELQRLREVAAGANVSVHAVSASATKVTMYCAETDVDELVRALHGALCG